MKRKKIRKVSVHHRKLCADTTIKKPRGSGLKKTFDKVMLVDESTRPQEEGQIAIDVRIEQLQSKMRSKDDMYRVLRDYRKWHFWY